MNAALRPALPADLDAIMELESSTFGTDAWSRESMRSELEGGGRHYLLAVDEAGAVVGYAGLLAPVGAREADIQTIAVAASARRHGVGRALMTALVQEAAERGASELFLEVRADNPNAQALYLSLGFEQIGTRPRYYQPDGVDALVLRLRLPRSSNTGEAR